MTAAEKHIQHFNRMNGNVVTKATLQKFLDKVPATPELKTLRKKLKSAIAQMNGKPVILEIAKPVRLGKIAATNPPRNAQLRAMFARMANDDKSPSKKKTKEKKQDEVVPPAIVDMPAPTKTEQKEVKKDVTDYRNDIDKNTAYASFNWTSFNPERRGETFRDDYAATLMRFIEEIKPRAEKLNRLDEFEEDFERYREKLKRKATDYLHSHSRVASSMIAGPANFPVERNRRASDRADNKLNDYIQYDKYIRNKLTLKYTPDEEKAVKTGQANALEILENRLKNIEESQAIMKAANKIIRSKKGDIEKRLKEIGLTEKDLSELRKAQKMYNTQGYAPFYLQNNNAEIRRLKDRINEVKKLAEKREQGNKSMPFNGGSIVENYDENRLQILFDAKPDEATRTKLKKNGFRWSPRFGAWQRQLTANAKFNLKYLLPEIGGALGFVKNPAPPPAAFANMEKKGKLWPQKRRKPGGEESQVITRVVKESPGNVIAESIPISKIHTDTKRFQNRQDAFSEASADSVAKNYDPNKFDPIVVWKDPKKKKLFVLSGHSRYEGMKRRKAKTIPVRYFKGSEQEAIKFAKVEANRSANQESLIEDLAAYKLMRDGDKARKIKKLTKTDLKKVFKGKVQKLDAYSHLSTGGLFVNALSQSTTSNYPYLERNAQWVGHLRSKYPVISNAGEDNIFHYFYSDKSGKHLKQTKDDFFSLVKKKVNQLSKSEHILFPECSSEGCKKSNDKESDPVKGESYKRLREINEQLLSITEKLTSNKSTVKVSTDSEKKYLRDLAEKLTKERDQINHGLEVMDKSQAKLFGKLKGPQFSAFNSKPSKKSKGVLNKLQQAQLQDSIKAGATTKVNSKAKKGASKKGWTDTPLFKNELDSRQQSLFGFASADQAPTQEVKTITLPGEIGKFIGEIQPYKYEIVVAGETHSSKSELIKQIADAFAAANLKVGFIDWEQGGMESMHTLKSFQRNVTPANRAKILVSGEVPRELDAVKSLHKNFDVVVLDSGTKLNEVTNGWIDTLREEHPQTIWVVAMQQNAKGGTRGGTSAEFDAPVVIKTYRPDPADYKKNYALMEKNRGNSTGLHYNISSKKLIKNV